MKKLHTPIVPVSFDSHAAAIGKAFKAFDNQAAKTGAIVAREMQAHCDAWVIANDKSEPSIKALGASIRDSQVVIDLVAVGAMPKKTFTEYANSAMRAVFHGVEWTASLKNDPAYALPWGKATGNKTTGSGKVSTTTRADADKTLSKALAQYRLLGLEDVAGLLLDVALDNLPDFVETVLDK